MDIKDRFEALAVRMGKGGKPLSNKDMAEYLGLGATTVQRMRAGQWRQPEEIEQILSHVGGKIIFDETATSAYSFVRRVNARPAAGGGSLENTGEEEDLLAFKKEWLQSRTCSSPDSLSVMTVSGLSMTPTLFDGDIVLVDEGHAGKQLVDGRIYIVRKGDETFVKRFRKGIGRLHFLSDNKEMSYLDLDIAENDLNDFAVFGRVLWSAREL